MLITVMWLAGWAPSDVRRSVDEYVSQPDFDRALVDRRADERLLETAAGAGLAGDALAVPPALVRALAPARGRGLDHLEPPRSAASPRGPPMIG